MNVSGATPANSASSSLVGDRKNIRPFGANKKVAKEPRGDNYANQRFKNGGVPACEEVLTGPCAEDVA